MANPTASSISVNEVVRQYFPAIPTSKGHDSDPTHLSHQVYPEVSYTDNEKIEISQWITTATRLATPDEDEAKHAERLGSLNIHLSTRTTLLGSKPSIADVTLYKSLAPAVQKWSPDERMGEQGYHHIVRFIDFVQNAPLFGLSVKEEDKVSIDPSNVIFYHKPLDAKYEKEKKKKEKAAQQGATKGEAPNGTAATGSSAPATATDKPKTEKAEDALSTVKSDLASSLPTSKKEKKPKAPQQPKAAPKETPLSPCLIDLRVGHILKAVPHPNADSLYVSTIACGDPPGTDNTSEYEGQVVRTVCSGLNGLVPLEEMQNRKIVAVCNLKPVTMRGVKSAAMVLAASPRPVPGVEDDGHKGPVELVEPPKDAPAGERIWFEGWEGEPEGVLNPKKKVWEMCQVGFTTTTDKEVGFEWGAVEQLKGVEGVEGKKKLGLLVAKGSGEKCVVNSLTGATVR